MVLSSRVALLTCGLLLSLSQSGCMVLQHRMVESEACVPSEIVVERGAKRPVIDGVGWVVGIPSKVFLWNRRVDNHDISPETEAQLRQYMAQNGLSGTKARLNQYAPGDEWRRLVRNDQVAPGWRYTFGAFQTLGYTVFPGRIFGGDNYNPYTNSVHIYSDVPSLAQLPAAYAKDVGSRQYPGTYVFTQGIAGVNMIHETINTRDVLAYTASNGTTSDLQEAHEVLSPHYGMALGQTAGSFVNINPANGGLKLVGLLGGHAVGRYRSSQISDMAPASPAISKQSVEAEDSVTHTSYEQAAETPQ